MNDSVIVSDDGFGPDDWRGEMTPLADLPANDPCPAIGIDLAPGDDLSALAGRLGCAGMIRVAFPSFADGRGFTIAGQLRRMGFSGRLRAAGHVIADQYAMARRAGFDEVEISGELAARQPEEQWLARADWKARDYQARLRG